ncbi:MAG: conserved rane protein of unknown function [Deltaproteobacteria bacterium]|nr:conserved rane protein of unknown function [Deltaproteobacteria bacterium]
MRGSPASGKTHATIAVAEWHNHEMKQSVLPEIGIPKGTFIRLSSAAVLILLLPLAGAAIAGKPLSPYLQFPPRTPDILHAPFSLPVFLGLSVLILAATAPFLHRLVNFRPEGEPRKALRPFPRWGWAGLAAMAFSWLLAWTRLPWMEALQAHTFTPLWLSHIVVVNALSFRRTGECLLLSRTRRFLLLFPASAAFWWCFEYLNRFVGNWYYLEPPGFGAGEYFLFATLPFATVLPAVLSTRELLLSFPRVDGAFCGWRPLSPAHPRAGAAAALLLSCAGLLAVGVVPDVVFPLVWVAPPAILVALPALRGEVHALSGISAGDWRPFAASSLAALACGFFWEMWNFGSLAKWVYAIPYVDALHVFEMPLPGYAGYLPFGVLCAEVGDRLLGGSPEKKTSPLPRQLG